MKNLEEFMIFGRLLPQSIAESAIAAPLSSEVTVTMNIRKKVTRIDCSSELPVKTIPQFGEHDRTFPSDVLYIL